MANVAEIPSAIPSRNVQATTERDGKVGEVSTNTNTLFVCLDRCSSRPSLRVIKPQMIVDKITNRLDAGPAQGAIREQLPGRLHQEIGLAVAAGKQVNERLFRQFPNRMLASVEYDSFGRS